jgi:hypothetical protein
MSDDPSEPLKWQDMLRAVVQRTTVSRDASKEIVKILREATEESWYEGLEAANSDDTTPEFSVDPAIAQLDEMLKDRS